MCVTVSYYPDIGSVSIDGESYTEQELSAKKSLTKVERSSLLTLRGLMKDEQSNRSDRRDDQKLNQFSGMMTNNSGDE